MRMNLWKRDLLRVGLICLLFFPAMGCSSREDKKADHLERAGQYLEKDKLKEAVIEFKNALQMDPEDDAALYELGEVHLKLNQFREAFESFAGAASINPDNWKAQLKLGQLFLVAGKSEPAKEKANLVLKKSPENLEALALLSGAQTQADELDSAVKTLQKAIELDPDNFVFHLSLGRLFVLKQESETAEKTFLKALSLNPESTACRMELAGIYEKQGEWERAESELKQAVRSSQVKYRDLQVLAGFYERREKWPEAEKTLQAAVEAAPPGNVSPLMHLAGYHARRNDYEQALAVMKNAAAMKKGDLNILTDVGQLHFDFKHFDRAERIVDEVLGMDGGHVAATFLKGRLSLVRNDYDGALKCFETVTRERPGDAMVYYFKALSLMGLGKRAPAEQALLKALERKPTPIDARFMLAELYLQDRKKELAAGQLKHLMTTAPRDWRTWVLDGDLKVLERNEKGAESSYKQAIELNPDHAPAYVRLGLYYRSAQREAAALGAFKTALELNPEQTDALVLMVAIYVDEKSYDKALQLCKVHQARVGEDSPLSAHIAYIEGTIHLERKAMKQAKERLMKAIEKDPNMLRAYTALAGAYMEAGGLSEAAAQYETLIRKDPQFVPAYMALGVIHDHLGDFKTSETYYRKALDIQPDFAPAANNLAWNMAQGGGNIDVALGFARIAKEQLPDNAAVMDTLGYIYYLKGTYLFAIAELEDSLRREPENPTINYHLGLAYHKNKQPEMAREFLEKSLQLDPNFEGADEARSVLETLKGEG